MLFFSLNWPKKSGAIICVYSTGESKGKTNTRRNLGKRLPKNNNNERTIESTTTKKKYINKAEEWRRKNDIELNTYKLKKLTHYIFNNGQQQWNVLNVFVSKAWYYSMLFFVSSYTYTQKESERNEKEALKSFLLYFAIGATNKWLNKWNRRSFSFLCLLWSHFYLGFFSLFIVVVTLFSKCSLHSSRISTALSLRCLCVLSVYAFWYALTITMNIKWKCCQLYTFSQPTESTNQNGLMSDINF